MKRKTLTLVLCLLATFALASIGFASWIITNPDVTVTGTTQGDFTVYNAKDLSVSVKVEITNGSFVFGAPSSQTKFDNPWLTMDGLATDSLTATIKLTVTNYESLSDNGLNLVIYDETSNLKDAIGSYYIKCETGEFSTGNVTLNSTTTSVYKLTKNFTKQEITNGNGVVTFNLTFNWGTAFGSMNPYNYYNAKEFDAKAATTLNGLYAKLNELHFDLIVTE